VPSNATVVSGGTGYTVGNVLTLVGGTSVAGAAQLTVATVSSGVITSVTISLANAYSVAPTNPVSVTGGTGSGATFTMNYVVAAAFTITNAGSGYIEQPTVTFSGGGGSGAAATASVGSATIIRSLGGVDSGTSLSFFTPGGEQVRILNKSNAVNRLQLCGNAAGAGADVTARGATANINLNLSAQGAGSIDFFTAGDSFTTQARVAHTASAVNFVQVTGAATGGKPTISAQGSDALIGLTFAAKSTENIEFLSNAKRVFLIGFTTGNDVNYLKTVGNAAGSAPAIQSIGTDTNINLTLTPKGTGRIQFGTYTGTILTPTGFIEIVDSGGTTRRLLVG
jgi:hypothetical protein